MEPNDDTELAAIRARMLRELRAPKPPPPEPAPAGVLDTDDASFPSLLAAHPRLVVDCWAAWCAPCRLVAPVVEELAREHAGRVTFAKLDVDANPRTAQSFAVQSIPTLLFFQNGRYANRVVGAVPKPQLAGAVRQVFRLGAAGPGPRRA